MTVVRTLNIAEAKKHFSEIVQRAAFAGETTIITRRGKPMARLVPLTSAAQSLADLRGWIDDDDPFLAAIDDIVEQRQRHLPRVVSDLGTSAADRVAEP
jgi:prevent-host-death family protein